MKKFVLIAGMLAITALSGCNKAKSPDAVATDVSNAEQKSETKVEDAKADAAKDTANAEAKVDDKSKDLNNTEAKGALDVAMTKADGDHKVALEKCNAMSGDAQKNCKDRADADHDAAKAAAKAKEAAQKQ